MNACKHPDGCPEPVHVRNGKAGGYCLGHANRIYYCGDPGAVSLERRKPPQRPCVHPDGCPEPGYGGGTANGWCRGHTQRIARTGEPGPASLKRSHRREQPCTVCGEPADGSRGLCWACYTRERRHGDPRAPKQRSGRKIGYRIPPIECKYPGCPKQGNGGNAANGWCPTHNHRNWRNGDPSIVKKLHRYTGETCSRSDCVELATKYALCKRHAGTYEARLRRARLEGLTEHHTEAEWLTVLEERGGVCFYCDEPATTRDHVVPLARGGADTIDNIRPACKPCNSAKNARELETFLAGR